MTNKTKQTIDDVITNFTIESTVSILSLQLHYRYIIVHLLNKYINKYQYIRSHYPNRRI